MNRDEYLEMLATEPATPYQRGAIMREFARLGVSDRVERLAVCAALLELDGLESTRDLVMGQAGQLVAALLHTRDRVDLPDVTAPPTAAAVSSPLLAIARLIGEQMRRIIWP